MIDRILGLDPKTILEPPASEAQLRSLRQALGNQTPSLLLELLARSNGGELPFCRFEPSPYLPPEGGDLWQHVAAAYPPSDLIERREFLPLGNDYGDALYCLNLRDTPASVTLVPFHARSEEEFERVAETFEEFLAQSLQGLEQQSRRRSSLVAFSLADTAAGPVEQLAELGVRLRFVDRALVIAAEKASSFADPQLLNLYEDETRSLFFTQDSVHLEAPLPYGILSQANELQLTGCRIRHRDGEVLSTGQGFQYLTERATMTTYPVWSLTLDTPLSRDCLLELDFEHQVRLR